MKDINGEYDLFNISYPRYKCKHIRLIELFGGIGAQCQALENLNADFEPYKYCEWNWKSCLAYNAIHIKDYTDYSKDMAKNDIISFLAGKGLSSDWNTSMNINNIKRISEKNLRSIYNSIIATHNLVNIEQVHSKDLEIKDTELFTYLLTYSFPCQDLSLAGKRAGMEKCTETRSGMLWQVERILDECKNAGNMPQVLLMENVPQVLTANGWNEWLVALEKLGYTNFVNVMNSKNYGIPQTRNRCFMLSIFGEYSYKFPRKIELKYLLRDMLDENVDKKYYLSGKLINFFDKNSKKQKERKNGFEFKPSIGDKIAKCITTKAGSRMEDNFVIINKNYSLKCLNETLANNKITNISYLDCYNHTKNEKVIGTITTGISSRNSSFIAIPIKDKNQRLMQVGQLEGMYESSGRIYSSNGLSPTISTCGGGNTEPKIAEDIESEKIIQRSHGYNKGAAVNICPSITSSSWQENNYLKQSINIRKLTPRECLNLMGFPSITYELFRKSKLSDSTCYHLAGDSIVVQVLMAIFGELLDIDYIRLIDESIIKIINSK